MKPKDFQQATANRILKIFKSGQNRILLADEVGLGKTIIARDVVRQVSDWHKHEKNDDHFKVIYICSNINIANQNAKKLGIKDLMNVSESRLSMQHLKIFQNNGINHDYEQLIPLTPATSFSMTSGCGNQQERALMFAHLRRLSIFENYTKELSKFMAYEAEKYWQGNINYYEDRVKECDANGSRYIEIMNKELTFRLDFERQLVDQLINSCLIEDRATKYQKRVIINKLRKVFAQISLDKLEPDLVIMDEFQRFRDLIAPSDDEQGMLSKQFLENTETKVLLLSATPYKPYSTLEEISEDESADHYKEFMEVMQFLFYDQNGFNHFKTIWQDYSRSLCEISRGDLTVLLLSKNSAESALYKSVCRTERFSSGIIDDSAAKEVPITSGDILSYSDMQSLIDQINIKDHRALKYINIPMDYVKSSPYLLSFMESYQFKKHISSFFHKSKTFELVSGNKSKRLLLKKSTIHNYQPIEPNNARLYALKEVVFEGGKNGAENLLWIPAAKPYYKASSVFEKNADYSKVLVFSAWEMVPRMLSVMLSYEAERLTIGKLFHNARLKRGRGYFASKEERRYGISRLKNEMEDIICLTSNTLAKLYCPEDHNGKNLKQLKRELAEVLHPKLESLKKIYNLTESKVAGAKAVIDLVNALDHPESSRPTIYPVDALEIMVNMAIGSPAICAMRIFDFDKDLSELVAKNIFVSMFNKAESSAILDLLYGSKNEDSYYQNIFSYCVDGNLQAVLDEYAHIINETGKPLADEMMDSFVDTSALQIDSQESFMGIYKEKPRLRTHFSVGYFNARISNENVQRTENIRKAFNSPFRPFVLSTTSIGQEGLDFHNYCRKIMHWNLPSNPIDLEQREGRINRYKCHAVRQNIANKYGDEFTWDAMFDKASKTEKGNSSDLVPFWNLADGEKGHVKIERIVPMYPLSQDRLKYNRLIRILSLYRLTLGQPRQEELIEVINREVAGQIDNELFMNLSPFSKRIEN
jgi:hypothetical protein